MRNLIKIIIMLVLISALAISLTGCRIQKLFDKDGTDASDGDGSNEDAIPYYSINI